MKKKKIYMMMYIYRRLKDSKKQLITEQVEMQFLAPSSLTMINAEKKQWLAYFNLK